ncbi:MAG TPA: type II toxin-antitoxin system VapC family toxin [Acetobacteraceae bacterium]|nr:type II toxin-antitoxin system VapC family toxin [Acetobacteraceae bacterium]
MSEYVIDASVVVKWVIDEPGTSQALKLRRHVVSAPDLLVADCANIVWKKLHRGELTAAEASLAIGLLVRADIELVPMRALARRAVDLSILLDHSAYDCLYLALAETAKRPFVTADTRLLRKLEKDRTAARLVRALDLAGFDA